MIESASAPADAHLPLLQPNVLRRWRAAIVERWLPLAAALLTLAITFVGVLIVEGAEQRQYLRERREEVLYQASAGRAGLERALHSRLYLAHSLAAYVVASPSLDHADFDSFARRMLQLQPNVQRIALARGTTVVEVYPRVGNETIVGTDLSSAPEHANLVRQAIESGNFVLGSPLRLDERSVRVVGYLPIVLPVEPYATADQAFWGVAMLAIDVAPLLEEAGIVEGTAGLRWALRTSDRLDGRGDVFLGDAALFEADPVMLEVSLPGDAWRLAAVPLDGWPTDAPAAWRIRGGGSLLAVALGILLYFLVRDPARMRAAVERATAAVSASERRFRALIDNSSDMIVLLDRAGRNTFTSPSAARVLGYPPGSLFGRDPFDIVHPDDREPVSTLFRSLVDRPGESDTTRYRLRAADGSWRWMEAIATNLLDDPSVGAIVVNSRDVTDRVEAYQALEDRVRERTGELASLLDVSRAVASSLQLDAVVELILDQTRRVLDYTGVRLWLLEGEEIVLLAERGPQTRSGAVGSRTPLSSRIAVMDACRTRRALVIPSADDDTPLARGLRAGMIAAGDPSLEHVRSFVVAPMLARERVIGVLSFGHVEPNRYDAHHAELAMAFANQAAVAIENARLFGETERRTREVEALYRADEVLLSSLRLDHILQAFVDVAAELLQAEKTSILVWDERAERLIMGATHGFGPEIARLSLAPNQGIAGVVYSSRQPVILEDAAADPRIVRAVVEDEGVRSLMAIPITVGGQVFGVFGVNYCRPHRFTAEDQRMLLGLAQRTALAIENARLYEQAQQAATLEERQRLARELHDAVTQTLFSASLIAEALPKTWARSATIAAERTEELRLLTRGALAEMRTLLVELRPTAIAEAKLDHLLRQLGEAITGRTRVPVRVTTEWQSTLPADVQIAFYRVAQEAIHNAVKHASPGQVEVELRGTERGVVLAVRDDGHGFDPRSVSGGHFGLGMMRERADAIGARLTVASTPDRGTAVTLTWDDTPRPERS